MLYISFLLSFSGQIRKKAKSDLNGVIVWQDEGDTAGGCSKQKAGANGRSALSEKRKLGIHVYIDVF